MCGVRRQVAFVAKFDGASASASTAIASNRASGCQDQVDASGQLMALIGDFCNKIGTTRK